MPHKDPEVRRAWRQAYAQKHYAEHKEYYAHKRDRQKQKLKRMVDAYVRHATCQVCRDRKAGPLRIVEGLDVVQHGIAWGWGPERLMRELQRTLVACARCRPDAF